MAFFPCSLEWAITIGELNGLYPDLCTIFEEPLSTATRNASGGIDKAFPAAWRVIGTDVRCRLSSALRQGSETNQGGKTTPEKANHIYFAVGQAVSATSRIVVTTLKRYKAGDDPDDNSSWSNPIFDVVFPHIGSDDILTKVEVEERL